MYAKRATALASYLNGLLSAGRVVFTRDEARKAIGASVGAFLDAAERQQRKHHLVSLAKVSTSSFHLSIWPGAALRPRGTSMI